MVNKILSIGVPLTAAVVGLLTAAITAVLLRQTFPSDEMFYILLGFIPLTAVSLLAMWSLLRA